MSDNYVFLMSVHNRIEADNVEGILEVEEIDVKRRRPGSGDFINIQEQGHSSVDIYIPEHAYLRAKEIIETEMARGDF